LIKGLTHDKDGIINQITKYRGKISAGFAAGEGSNNTNHPVAAGFFRMLVEITKTKRVGTAQTPEAVKEWVLNKDVQEALEKHNNGSKSPRCLQVVSLYKTIEEMWESSLSMYSKTEGLLCKSYGENTPAKFLEFDPDGKRKWVTREFNGNTGCPYKECPDFKAGKCKHVGLLKCFPSIDLNPNPYRFETRSINTIMGIESALNQLWSLTCAAHAVKQQEADKSIPFEGLFGAEFMLIHKKVKSGGKDVFITDLKPSPKFTAMIMEPIKRGFLKKSKSALLPGAQGEVNMLVNAGAKLIESVGDNADLDTPVPMELDDQKELAINFPSEADSNSDEAEVTEDSDKNIGNDVKLEASNALLDEEGDDAKS